MNSICEIVRFNILGWVTTSWTYSIFSLHLPCRKWWRYCGLQMAVTGHVVAEKKCCTDMVKVNPVNCTVKAFRLLLLLLLFTM